MKNSKAIQVATAYYQDIVDGKVPFYLCTNDADYKTGDEIVFIEFDQEQQKEVGRRCYATITYLLTDKDAGIFASLVLFSFHTKHQTDYIRDYDKLCNKILPEYEKLLSHRMGGDLTERLYHVLHTLHASATDSIYKAKHFVEDVKVQFKALEIIMEGITSQGKNHTEKRVIANHVIEMLRNMIDKIDGFEWEFTSGMHDRYNFFRSNSPEASLIKRYKELKWQHEQLEQRFKEFSEKVPDEYKSQDLPF